MGNKEIVLKILKKNKDGLTFAELNKESNIGHSLYEYLKRLNDDGLVETFIPKTRVGRVVGFRAIGKAWEKERKDALMDNLVLLMIKAGVNSDSFDIDIKESDINESVKRLEEDGKLG